MCESLTGFLEYGAAVFCHQVLWQIGYHAVLGGRDGASCGGAYACDNLEQGALACAILAHQGYTVLLVDLEGNVFE